MAQHFKHRDPAPGGSPAPVGAARGTTRGGAPVASRRSRRRTAALLGLFAVVVLAGVAIWALLLAPMFASWGAQDEPSASTPAAPDTEPAPEPEPSEEELLAQEVEDRLSQMTLEQKVAQMFIVRPESLTGVGQVTAAGETTRQALEAMPVGGIIYFADNLQDTEQTRAMLANTKQYGLE